VAGVSTVIVPVMAVLDLYTLVSIFMFRLSRHSMLPSIASMRLVI
jgi:hypothetical protein